MKKLLVILAMVLVVNVVNAADFKYDVYGKIMMEAFYEMDNAQLNLAEGTGRAMQHNTFDLAISSISRIGTNLSYKDFSATFELGLGGYDGYDKISVPFPSVRLFYATYDFGKGGKLTIGQDWTITGFSFGQETYAGNGLCDYGAVNNYRRPQLRYEIAGFQFAVVYKGWDIGNKVADIFPTFADNMDVNQILPRFQVAYNIASDIFEGSVFADYGYYAYKAFDDVVGSGNDAYVNYAINSFHVGFGGTFHMGESFMNLTAFYGQNMLLSSALTGGLSGFEFLTPYVNDDGKVQDIASFGGAIGFGHSFMHDRIVPQFGIGYIYSNNPSAIHSRYESFGAFVNVEFALNEFLYLIPEFAYMADMPDGFGGKEQRTRMYAGAELMVKF